MTSLIKVGTQIICAVAAAGLVAGYEADYWYIFISSQIALLDGN